MSWELCEDATLHHAHPHKDTRGHKHVVGGTLACQSSKHVGWKARKSILYDLLFGNTEEPESTN